MADRAEKIVQTSKDYGVNRGYAFWQSAVVTGQLQVPLRNLRRSSKVNGAKNLWSADLSEMQ